MKKITNLYIDLEWNRDQKIFLICYKHSYSKIKQLYGKQITKKNVLKMLKPVTGYIFFYGPDIGMLEKTYKINIRTNYRCLNLYPLARRAFPNLKNYKLATIEKYLKIKRSQPEYKTNIFRMINDWNNPKKRDRALEYNKEDVANLVIVKIAIFKALPKNTNFNNFLLN